jgi:hypothetical protein
MTRFILSVLALIGLYARLGWTYVTAPVSTAVAWARRKIIYGWYSFKIFLYS